ATGIGHALAEQLAGDGYEIIAIDRDPLPERWSETGFRTDLSDRASVDQLIGPLREAGPYDLVIHNAGISATGRFEDVPEAALQKLLAVNCEAPLVITSALLRDGALSNSPTLIFMASVSRHTGYPGAAVYAASKDVLAVYARSIRKDLRRRGIHVMTVFPGPVRTAHAERHAPAGADASKRMEPAKIADAILKAAKRRKSVLYPGWQAKMGHVLGVLAPGWMTRFMHRTIFEKLDRTVY
ncbi:MAG: SDR family NAD(P)-dependent oxidoreductase, partial [Pseudomonadota bacterium]